MIDEGLKAKFLQHVEDSRSIGVPEIHFEFWNRVPEEVKQSYVTALRSDPDAVRGFEEHYLGADPDFDALDALPPGTLGHGYARHVLDNNLTKTIASDYRRAHERLDDAGALSGMPDEVKYAVVRGFQVHDIFHVLSGYPTDGWGEIGLQAFTLAQTRMPYAAIWMATLTTQMTFLHPERTELVMDAIAHGWQYGKQARPLRYVHWEERLDEPLEDLRAEFGLQHAETAAAGHLPASTLLAV